MSGHIPEIALSAQKAIYQGIHLSQAAVTASSIRVNLGQVIRRKPLRLLAPFPIHGAVELTEADFNDSLQSPLLGEGLYDFLQLLARSQPETTLLQDMLNALPERTVHSHYQASAAIQSEQVILRLQPKQADVTAIAISTQLSIRDGHRLCLDSPHWLTTDTDATPSGVPLSDLHGFEIDLGNEVTLTDCQVADQKLKLSGTIRVLPTEPDPAG